MSIVKRFLLALLLAAVAVTGARGNGGDQRRAAVRRELSCR